MKKNLLISTKGKLSTNLLTNLLNLSLTVIIGIFLVPYLVKSLGIEFYGIIPIANYFLQYLTLSAMALNSAVGRYITIALEKNDIEESKRLFNTAFWGNVAIVSLLLVATIPIVTHLDTILTIPSGALPGAQFLFFCAFSGLFVSLITNSFSVSTWCLNRFDIRNGISVARQAVYIGILVVLFSFYERSLFSVGMAMLAGAITTAVLNYTVCRRFLPHLRLSWKYFDKRSLQKLLSTGGWITINMIGSILYLKIDLLIINRFLGATEGGRYAAVLQWAVVLRMLGAAISNVFGPPLTYLHAQGEKKKLAAYARKAIRYLGLIIALPIGLLCGFAHPLLTLWLGEGYGHLSGLLILLTLHLCVNISVYPLFELQTATNKVRLPGLLTCIMGVLNLVAALLLVTLTDMGVYGVALAGGVLLTLKNAIFTPIYGALIIQQPWYFLLRETLITLAATVFIFAAAWGTTYLLPITTWLELIYGCVPASVTYSAIVWWLILDRDERHTTINSWLIFWHKKAGAQ